MICVPLRLVCGAAGGATTGEGGAAAAARTSGSGAVLESRMFSGSIASALEAGPRAAGAAWVEGAFACGAVPMSVCFG